MSVFGGFPSSIEGSMQNELKNNSLFEEMCIVEEFSHFTDDQRKQVLESGVLDALCEAGKFRKKTLVRLSGQADFDRRNKLAAMALAKENNDPLFDKLALNRVKERELLGKIMQKYGNKGARVAKASQKDYIRNRMPSSFMAAGGAVR